MKFNFVFLSGLLLLSLQVNAEGAVRTFECTLERACDSGGQCEATEGDVEFRLEPQQLDNKGAGSYLISYEGRTVTMQASSDAGPFVWTMDNVQHTLLVNSETRLLWHSLSLDSPLQSRSRFMACTLGE